MNRNYCKLLGWVALSASLLLIGPTDTSVSAKPVPGTPSIECQRAAADFYRLRDEWNRLRNEWNNLKQRWNRTSDLQARNRIRQQAQAVSRQGKVLEEKALGVRDWYRKHCLPSQPPAQQLNRYPGNCIPDSNHIVSNCVWYDLGWKSGMGRSLSCWKPEFRQRNPGECKQICICCKRSNGFVEPVCREFLGIQ